MGMKALNKTLSRVARMGWEERRTRLAQAVGNRVDLVLYQTGLLSRRNGLRRVKAAGESFFFSQTDLPRLVSLLREKMAAEVGNIIREADEICRHRFRLLGYDSLDYGAEIDWHLDAVNGKGAPMLPWFKIDFLNFDEVGDHKAIWELNRHQHLVTLAKAWCFTRDEHYAAEVEKQWHSWQMANPYPIGINWCSSLEVAFRSLSWVWVLSLLSESQAVAETFRADVIRALAINGRYIERNLSTYFSPNTHLLGEALALFFVGTMCPQIAAADRLRNKGWEIILREAERQVRPDGVYFEQSLHYHVYALDFFLHARVLASHNGMNIPVEFDLTLNKMLDVLSALSQSGPTEGFGDDDGGRVFNPRRNRAEHMTDPLALGAILFQREDLKSAAALTGEAIWLFGERAVSFLNESASIDRKIEARSFNDGGIYVMASAQTVPQQMVIDAGPQGTGRGGHGHADALSVSATVGGRRWLVDPGTFCYMCGERDRFRGTGAHNTLRVDGLDQAVPEGPFGWGAIPEVRCEKWIAGETFTLFSGSHSGYMRLADPVLHRRYVFHLHDQFWLVRDLAEGRGTHNLELHWHFASDVAVSKIENGFVANPKVTPLGDNGETTRFALLPREESGWKSALDADYVSPAYGKRDSASVVRLSAHTVLPAEHATLMLPASSEIGKFSRVRQSDEAASVYRYVGIEKTHYMIFVASPTGRWSCSVAEPGSAGQPRAAVPTQVESDASFLYFASEEGRIARFILCGGSIAEINGKPVMSHSKKIEWFEWDSTSGKACSSDDAAVQSFSPSGLAPNRKKNVWHRGSGRV
jgi:hypothetical protein